MSSTTTRLVRVAVAATAIGLLASCQPITHPTKVEVERYDARARVQRLSGDGRVVLVSASGPAASVPGAGTWRVERGGAATAVPGGAIGLSRDGSRIAYPTGVWRAGALVSAPGTLAAVSEDVTFGLYVTGGVPHRWDLRTGATRDLGSVVAAPAGTSGITAEAVSDDGNVVLLRYTFPAARTLFRFLQVDTGQTHDLRPAPTDPDAVASEDTYVLAADGSAFIHNHAELGYQASVEDPPRYELNWVELVGIFPRQVRWRSTLPEGTTHVAGMAIADTGAVGWAVTDRTIRDASCGDGSPTFVLSCVVQSDAIAVVAGGSQAFPLLTGPTRRVTTDRTGRLLAVDRGPNELERRFGFAPPTQVVDRIGDPAVETLPAVHATPSTSPMCPYRPSPCLDEVVPTGSLLSDDGRLVVTASSAAGGWYEFGPPPGT